MKYRIVLAAAAWVLLCAIQLRPQQAKTVDFEADIQPIFAARCQSCHQGGAPPADLRLDSPVNILAGGVSGRVVVPGKSDESLLIQRVTGRNGIVMPPSGAHLSAAEIGLIAQWIDQGAKLPGGLYVSEIQPILSSACYSCHSGDQARAGLNLSIKASALRGGASGVVIVPGDSAKSRLVHRIKGLNGERQMPLGKTPLTEEQIAKITRWIDAGAEWPDNATISQNSGGPKHWAYTRVARPALPAVRDAAWVRNAIDRFVLARLEKEGLKPSTEANKNTLLRRVSLDLTGLPPTPAEIDTFLADNLPGAYERLVDRLLASPHYGERWATPWLDLARYGDSEGWTTDRQRVAWPYRDWVIRALNNNMPFDQFTREQLAGDLLPNPTTDQKIATGFVRSSMLLTEAGTDPEENNWIMQIDRASTIGTVFLGSTLGCAQCHNHKYDPFTQKQFYQMVAFFSNSSYINDPPDNRTGYDGNPLGETKLDLPTAEQARIRDKLTTELRDLEKQLNDPTPAVKRRQREWERGILDAEQRWQTLRPNKLRSASGTTLTMQPDGSVLASGKNPDTETYVIEADAVGSQITGLRIEALVDPSLPGGGPGRDYYGNFIVRDVTVEAGRTANLVPIPMKEIASDLAPPPIREDVRFSIKQLWPADVTRAIPNDVRVNGVPNRPRVQLLLIPEKPIALRAGDMLRINIVHHSEISGVNLGHFRLSFTSSRDPKVVLSIPAGLRPILSVAEDKRAKPQTDRLLNYYRTVDAELDPVRQKIAKLQESIEDLHIPSALIMEENRSVTRPFADLRIRGAFLNKGERVEADVPGFLGSLPAGEPMNRLGLAKWLVSKDNPLTARVTVNRFWQTIFGQGIVETSEDFGTQGFAPSHPELLDWLAAEFMENGWDMKAILRLVVTSNTYRQSSSTTRELLEKDPVNVLLARGPRFRVEAEMVRDIALTASGLLSHKQFGPPVKPYQPEGLWGWFPGSRVGTDVWEVSPGEDRYRRAIYTFIRRSVRYPSLTVFDAPSREFCISRRSRSDTPLQALTTLNDPAFFEASKAMARRVLTEGGASEAGRVNFAFKLVTSRLPDAIDRDALLSAITKAKTRFEKSPAEAEKLAGTADSELAAWIMLSNSLLNLDEVMTKE